MFSHSNLYIVPKYGIKKMVKKCIYCKGEISSESVVDVCRRCGIGVWGEKMFNAIVSNMENAKEAGDLYQGSVTEPSVGKKTASFSLGQSDNKL